uniref:ribonuclease H n=1 Tax=viral metagenome TaxID=1070528 RepID=A0A6C0EQ19_9ZZZZ
MKVEVYTDGACSKNGKKDAQASWAFYFPEYKSISNADRVPEDQTQTNQRGELMAISEAVKAAEIAFPLDETDLKINTDSMYSKNCLTNWLSSWVRNKWKTSQGGDVIHRDIIEDTANRLSRFKSFNIVYVKAHTGGLDEASRNNHIVDRMASKVLNPDEEIKEIVSNGEEALDGCPLKLMGAPVCESDLVAWCLSNVDKLDTKLLNAAIISAFSKTIKKKGFEVEKQRLHRTVMFRLKTETGLIKEGITIVKEE